METKDWERFMSYVLKTDTCWVWLGNLSHNGYGQFDVKGKTRRAHRLILAKKLGRPISIGMIAAHSSEICHNRACVNPDHLRETTQGDNLADRIKDDTHPTGENNGSAKLTDSDIIAIRADTRSQSKIGVEYGVSQMTISYIKRRKTWSHI